MEEPLASESFRERVLAGGSKVQSLFGDVERNTAIQYLAERYPSPKVIPAALPAAVAAVAPRRVRAAPIRRNPRRSRHGCSPGKGHSIRNC